MTAPEPRPGQVTAAFWMLVIGAVLLMAGGLLAVSVSFDYLREMQPPAVSDQSIRDLLWQYRGAGILFCIAAFALLILAVRTRRRDPRYRRAAIALGLVTVILVSLFAAFQIAGLHILALLSMVPIIVGTLLLGRPAAVDWFTGRADAGF